ncbi:MAG: endoribonuclease MazF [Puniceicoccaceae bacterium]
MVSRYVPSSGDLVWLTFTPQAGHEQAGHRPALVISQKSYNQRTGLALFCPLTSRAKGYPFEVECRGTKVNGVVLADQVKSLDWKVRNARRIESAPDGVLEEALAKLKALLPAD